MSLERALHELWSSDFGLTALVPAKRLFTGAAADGAALPYVVLTRQGNKPAARTSSGRTIDETAVRFTIWSPRLDTAKRIPILNTHLPTVRLVVAPDSVRALCPRSGWLRWVAFG